MIAGEELLQSGANGIITEGYLDYGRKRGWKRPPNDRKNWPQSINWILLIQN